MTAASGSGDIPLQFLRRRRFGRICALRFLYQADVNGAWELKPTDVQQFWDQAAELNESVGDRDFSEAKTFAQELIQGVLAQREAIDAKLVACADNWRIERMSIVDRNILRLAAFELLNANRGVTPATAMDEAVELAKEFGDKDSYRFVNGVLDRLARDAGKV